jgi:uncharacterized protein YjdB
MIVKVIRSLFLFALFLTLSVLLTSMSGGKVSAASTLQGIELDASDVYLGSYNKIYVTAKYSDGSTKDVSLEANYVASTDEGQVRIYTSNGMPYHKRMEGTKIGWVTLEVSYTENGITYTDYTNLRVKPSLKLTLGGGNLPVGKTDQLKTQYSTILNVWQDVTNSATYSSSNPSVATVSSTGKVTAVAVGTTTISVSYPDTYFGGTITISYNLKVY